MVKTDFSCNKKFPGTRSDKGGGAIGPVHISVDGKDEPFYLLAAFSIEKVDATVDKKISFNGDSRLYVIKECPTGQEDQTECQYGTMGGNPKCGFYQVASQNLYQQWKLLNKKLSFDVNTSGAGFCCDLAIYLASMPAAYVNKSGETVLYDGSLGDFYCDANAWASICPGRSNPNPPRQGSIDCPSGVSSCNDYIFCPELDLLEVNENGIHITPHSCAKIPDKYLFEDGSAGMYMTGKEFSADFDDKTKLPKNVIVNDSEYAKCSQPYGNTLCDGVVLLSINTGIY